MSTRGQFVYNLRSRGRPQKQVAEEPGPTKRTRMRDKQKLVAEEPGPTKRTRSSQVTRAKQQTPVAEEPGSTRRVLTQQRRRQLAKKPGPVRRKQLAARTGPKNKKKPMPTKRKANGMSDITRVVKGYDFYHVLGSGTFGTVFKARHQKTGKIVAIKEILPANEEGVSAYTLREIGILGQLSHRNIIGYLYLETNTLTYIHTHTHT